jgi:hypothetical protein
MNHTVREPHQRHALELPKSTESAFEVLPLADREVSRNWLDVLNFAEEVEIHLHDSSLTTEKLPRKHPPRPGQ